MTGQRNLPMSDLPVWLAPDRPRGRCDRADSPLVRLDPPTARIAVFRALFLGDLLCASPALRALRRRFPEAEITLIGLPWAADLVSRWGYVDRFDPFPGWPGLAEVPADPAASAAFLGRAHATGSDLALQLHGSGPASNGFVAALGARATLGYALGADDRLTCSLPWREDEHEIERWLGLVAALGDPEPVEEVPSPDRASGPGAAGGDLPDFATTADEARRARDLLAAAPAGDGPFVALHPGAKDPARRWHPERFAALAAALAADHGARLLLTGAESERPLTAALRAALPPGVPVLDLAGATVLGTFAALIAGLDLLVTNDTGASHLAAAARTASVVLFGPSRPERWAPLDRSRHLIVDAAEFDPRSSPGRSPILGEEPGGDLAALPVEPVLAACDRQLSLIRRGQRRAAADWASSLPATRRRRPATLGEAPCAG